MSQSKFNSQQDTPSIQKGQIGSVLLFADQKMEKERLALDQRNLNIENPKKKWEISEFREWLCFMLQHSIDSPYADVEEELSYSRYGDKIYQRLQQAIGTKNRMQCFKFTRKLLRELKKQTKQGLVNWCVMKLKKMAQHIRVAELLREYQIFVNQKSPYMKILGRMTEFYEMEEGESLRGKEE